MNNAIERSPVLQEISLFQNEELGVASQLSDTEAQMIAGGQAVINSF